MNISGVRPSNGFYDDNIIRKRLDVNPIPQDTRTKGFGEGPAASVEISKEGMMASKKEVIKAVSDMEKDTAIHRYQYFVQSNPSVESPSVRGTENFSL